MLNKTSTVLVSLVMQGQYLIQKAEYSDAVIKDGQITVNSKQTKAPVYKNATKELTLGWQFIEMALERPKVPKKGKYHFLKTPLGKEVNNWKKLTDEQKIGLHVHMLADSLDCRLSSFEVLE